MEGRQHHLALSEIPHERGMFRHATDTLRRHTAFTSGEQSTAILGGTAEPVTAAEVPRPRKWPFLFLHASGLFYFYSLISRRNCVLTNERVVVRFVSVSAALSTIVVVDVSGASAFDSERRSFSSGL